MSTATVELRADSRQVRRATDDLRRLESRGESTTNAISGLRRAFVALGAAAAVRGATRTIADFSQQISSVAAISGATSRELALLREETLRLGSTTRFSASEAAAGAQFLARAGFDTNQILSSLNETLTLAQAGNLDLASAADIASNVLTGFRISADEAGRAVDVLAFAANRSNTDVQQLGDALSFVAPIAAGLSVSLEETTAAIGALSDAGLQGSTAGTGLRRVLSTLESPTAQATKRLAELGVSAEEVQVSSVGLTAALERLRDAGITTGEALEIFGDRGGPAFEVLSTSIPRVREMSQALGEAGGFAQGVADVMDDNLNGALLSVRSATEGLIISLGDLGSENAATQGAQSLAAAIRTLTDNLETVVQVGTVVAAVFGARMASAFIASTQAKAASVTANVALLQSEARLAASAQARAVQEQAAAARSLAMARNDTLRAGAITRLAAANQTLTAATAASTAATARYASAATAAGVATRALNASLTLVGGPAGVAALAAFGVFRLSQSYRDGLQAQEDRTQRIMEEHKAQQALNKELREAGRLFDDTAQATSAGATSMDNYQRSVDAAYAAHIQGMSQAQIQDEFDSVTESLARAESRMARVSERFAEGTLRYQQAQEEVRKLRAQVEALGGAFPNLTTSAEQASEALLKVTQSIEDEIFQLEQGTEAYDLMIAARQAGVEIGSVEAEQLRILLERRKELNDEIRAEAEAEREAQQAKRQAEQAGRAATELGRELDIGGNPARQAEDQMFERLSILDNALAMEQITKEEHRQREIQAEQAYQERLTEISGEAERARAEQAEREAQQRAASTEAMFSSLGDVFGNFAQIAREGGEESFGTYKALASAQAAMSAAVAINRALAEGGPFLGPALAASIAALTGAQIAQISQQQYTPRALGGQVRGGQEYLVGERGPELVTMGGNGNVTPFNQLKREAGQGGNQGQAPVYLNITMDEKAQEDKVTQTTQDDKRIIDVVVANGRRRGAIHKMITETTNATNRSS